MTISMTLKEARKLGIIPETPGKKREMTLLEIAYQAHLDYLKSIGSIQEYRYEWFRFILYHGLPGEQREASYKMDFLVIKPMPIPHAHRFDRGIEIHEVKGHWRSRDRIRFKIAAEMNPWFSFIGVQKDKNIWIYERF